MRALLEQELNLLNLLLELETEVNSFYYKEKRKEKETINSSFLLRAFVTLQSFKNTGVKT
jgi:hypothetical protein